MPLSEVLAADDPLVSVIIPSYNKAQFLPESVQSALDQSYKNLEIVIVNDGSTDNSTAVARQIEHANISRKFLILDKPNGGISDARNFGITRCSGRIVCCLDGDDIAGPTFVEKALAAMKQVGANLICCNVELFGAETGEWIPQSCDQYSLRYNNDIPTLVMYDKVLWSKAGGYSVAFPFNEDWEFFVRLSRHGLMVHKISEKLFRYRVTDGGLAQSYIKNSWGESVGLIITSNTDLYPVEHVLLAHKSLLSMRPAWAERFAQQSAQYPNQWILRFWLGLAEEGQNRSRVAFEHYNKANEIAGGTWQVLYRLAALMELDNKAQAAQMLHAVRVLRPDMNRLVEERIKNLAK